MNAVRAFDAAWSVIKADPNMSIRELSSYSREYDRNPAKATMNPIIARLVRERNEAAGRKYGTQRPQGIQRLENAYPPGVYYPEGRVGHNIYL